jgi:hypothetical protein
MEETCHRCANPISRRAKANVWGDRSVVCTPCLKELRAAEQRATAARELAGIAGADWLVFDGKTQHGPYATGEVISLLRAGRVDWL